MYMTLNDMTQLDILRAIFSLGFVIISFIVGIKIILKYFKYKNNELITIGLTWIFISSSWWSLPFTFITILLFNYLFDPVLYLFFMRAFVPVALICWIYSFSILVYPEYKKKIFFPYLIICIIYEIVLLYFLCFDYTFIATYEGGFTYRHSLFSTVFLIFAVLSVFITMLLFSKKSLKSIDKEIQWKGRFYFLAIFSSITAAFLDLFSTGNPILQLTLRIILTFSAIEYYFGFFLPKFISNRLIQE